VSDGGRANRPLCHGSGVCYLTEENDQGMELTIGVVATVVGAAGIAEHVKRSLP
jgi:hypothetical protein